MAHRPAMAHRFAEAILGTKIPKTKKEEEPMTPERTEEICCLIEGELEKPKSSAGKYFWQCQSVPQSMKLPNRLERVAGAIDISSVELAEFRDNMSPEVARRIRRKINEVSGIKELDQDEAVNICDLICVEVEKAGEGSFSALAHLGINPIYDHQVGRPRGLSRSANLNRLIKALGVSEEKLRSFFGTALDDTEMMEKLMASKEIWLEKMNTFWAKRSAELQVEIDAEKK
ncbi:MAG: hypothetical protein Q8Q90_02640 [bacterium]|nr:hypothetical protein [bacterium]